MPHIPLELVHHILASVGKDHPTLSSCSLVCRSWMSEAHSFIFEEVRIASSRFVRSDKEPRDLGDLAAFLRQSSRVCMHIRMLTLTLFDPSLVLLRQVVQMLPALVYLTLTLIKCHVPPDDLAGGVWTQDSNTLPSLNTLIIRTTRALQSVPLVLSMFSHIHKLVLFGDPAFGHANDAPKVCVSH